jgi:hypothetical protein
MAGIYTTTAEINSVRLPTSAHPRADAGRQFCAVHDRRIAKKSQHLSRLRGRIRGELKDQRTNSIVSVYRAQERAQSQAATSHPSELQLARIPGHFDITRSGNGLVSDCPVNLHRAFPVSHPRASIRDQFLLGKGWNDFQLDLLKGNNDFPLHRILGAAFRAFPTRQYLNSIIL